MGSWLANGRAVDLILLLLVVEALALVLLRRRGIGPGLAPLLPLLTAGACLLLALRAALTGAPIALLALWLAAAGLAHGTDLARRFRAC